MSKSRITYFCLCLVFLVLIVWRYQMLESRFNNSELRKYNDSGQEITLIGTVVKEPDVRERSIKLTIKVIEVRPLLNSGGRTSAKLLLTVARYPEYKYGDELKITGKLQTPLFFEDFNYKNYLATKGISSVIYYPKIELLSRGNYRSLAPYFYAWILRAKNKLRESVYGSLPFSQSSILGAMILGDKNRMSGELKEKLNVAGLRHITAVSGLHIVLISGILMSLLLGLGFWRGQAFYLSLVFIFLFIALTGFQVSSIRAGIMAGLFLLGQKIGRRATSSRSIIIAAGIILIVNPLLIWDVGFQLSFLAALGIIYLSSTFQRWLTPHLFLKKKGEGLRTVLSMTFSAYLFTLPILIYNFGQISLVAPLTNVLILPIVSLIMVSGFIFGLAGIIWQPLGWLLSFPCWFLLTYLIKIVDFFSQPWAAKGLENIHWLWLIIFYLILAIFVYWLKKRERLKFLNY